MKQLRYGLIVVCMLASSVTFAEAQVNIGIGLPNVSIGINLPLFPQLVRVPGYPVYYAPHVSGNYFFYDGMYWVYQNDGWYASSWYNGPWGFVEPDYVPLFILRVPVSYYRQPPIYFGGWASNSAPRWGQHWGGGWEQRRRGWDSWKRSSAPAPAPLPTYQRQYSGDRYPRVEQQQTLRTRSYRYQPRDKVVRQHFEQSRKQAPATVQPSRRAEPVNSPVQQQNSRPAPVQHGRDDLQRSAPNSSPRQSGPAMHEQRQQQAPREQQAPRGAQGQQHKQQERGDAQDNREHGQGQNKNEERGRGHNK